MRTSHVRHGAAGVRGVARRRCGVAARLRGAGYLIMDLEPAPPSAPQRYRLPTAPNRLASCPLIAAPKMSAFKFAEVYFNASTCAFSVPSPPTYQSRNHRSSFQPSSQQQANEVLHHGLHVSPDGPRYFGGTFLRFNALPPPTLRRPTTAIVLSILSNCCSISARCSSSISSTRFRRPMSTSTDIPDRFTFGIVISGAKTV